MFPVEIVAARWRRLQRLAAPIGEALILPTHPELIPQEFVRRPGLPPAPDLFEPHQRQAGQSFDPWCRLREAVWSTRRHPPNHGRPKPELNFLSPRCSDPDRFVARLPL